ncbi:MAG: thiamine pyrophosphate-dependent enzyme, partial [Candidatus Diapherotrites archaeon]
HGIVHRLLAEAIDEFGLREKTIGIAPVGCAVFAYNYFNVDMIQVPHGRAPAVATGVKRVLPENFVFTYQGDGDLAAIGTAETVHAANRGENITVIFINNAIYGMTGGQMAPTTLLSQKTNTTPYGRKAALHGYPVKVCELLATMDGVAFAERVTVSSPANIIKAKSAIKRAVQAQLDKEGFSIVEVLSHCPTNWGLKPLEAIKWVEEEMTKTFPLGKFKDKKESK